MQSAEGATQFLVSRRQAGRLRICLWDVDDVLPKELSCSCHCHCHLVHSSFCPLTSECAGEVLVASPAVTDGCESVLLRGKGSARGSERERPVVWRVVPWIGFRLPSWELQSLVPRPQGPLGKDERLLGLSRPRKKTVLREELTKHGTPGDKRRDIVRLKTRVERNSPVRVSIFVVQAGTQAGHCVVFFGIRLRGSPTCSESRGPSEGFV